MKRLVLTCAALAFAAGAGTANADPITVTNIEIWNAATPGSNANSPNQQALPTNPLTGSAPVANVTGTNLAPDGEINLNIPGNVGGSSTIGDFLKTDPDINTSVTTGSPTSCDSTCQGKTLSAGGFAQATLFKFTFTVPSSESPNNMFSGKSDDGESLFLDGNTTNNLFDDNSSAPRFEGTNSVNDLMPGKSYTLYYLAANGDPETIIPSLVTTTPEPASLALLGSALAGLGLFRRRRRSITVGRG